MSKLYTPKNKLKEKVGEGGFNPVLLEDAQKAIEENDIDFVPIAEKLIGKLDGYLKDGKDDPESLNIKSKLLDQLTQLRAQGSMFHYPSITAVTDVVVDLMDSVEVMDKTLLKITEKYSQSAKVVLGAKTQDEKDKVVQAIIKELRDVAEKYKEKHAAEKE